MVRSLISSSVEHELATLVIDEAKEKNVTVSELIRNMLKERYNWKENNIGSGINVR